MNQILGQLVVALIATYGIVAVLVLHLHTGLSRMWAAPLGIIVGLALVAVARRLSRTDVAADESLSGRPRS